MFEVENAVVVLQKLSSEHPVLTTAISHDSDVIRWRKGEPCLVWMFSVKFHVGVERHLDAFAANSEFQSWKLHVFFLSDFARPEWSILLAIYSMLFFEVFHHGDERFLWNKAEAHTVIDNELLSALGESFITPNLDILRFNSPVLIVFGLVSPEDIIFFSSLFGELTEVIATKDHLTWNRFIVGKVDTEHWLEIFVEVLVILKLGDKAWYTIV